MVVIPAQTKFLMGSAKNEAERSPDDQVQQPQVIGRTFAIAVKSVTGDQFRRSPKGHDYVSPLAPKGDCPVIAVTWYMAAEYCNWLSVMEGLERCYEPNKDGEYQAGMKLVPDYLNRTGYRLATQAEWECACRAGAKTSRYYGESIDLLGKYAWYVGNSGHRPWPVASLKPNDWGLFDVHGNVWTWCQDDSANGTDSEFRPIRGGSFVDAPAEVRAACRVLTVPMRESPYVGLRPTRTFR